MIIARQSTARTVMVGPVLDADGVAVTGGVVGDFKGSVNGGAPAALDGSATLTHRATGHYSLALTATDLATVGTFEIIIDDTVNACPVKEITVIEEAIYDAMFAASANAWSGAAGSTTLTALASGSITAAVIATGAIDADAIADNAIDAGALAADCITAAKIADGAIDAATFAAGAIDAAAIAADAGTEIGTAVWASGTRTLTALDEDSTTLDLDTTIRSALGLTDNDLDARLDVLEDASFLIRTTIASLSSQTSFTLTDGSADNDAYNGCVIVIEDASSAVQKAVGVVGDYTGSTKTVTLQTDPAVFTMATSDIVTILPCRALKATVDNRTLDVSTGGEAGLDWANVGSPTTTVGLSGTTVKTATDVETDTADIQSRLPAALVGGRIDANVGAISSDATAADNAEAFFDGTGYAGTNNVIPLVTTTTTATNVTTVNGLAANVITAASIAADAGAEIADAVWDEATSGHTTAGTFGQAMYILRANTAQAGASTTITLDASASSTDDIYNYCLIVLTAGTGAGQARYITDYNGTTKVATVATWATNPSSDSVFVILPGGQIPGATAPTAAEVADAVWDEAQSGHTSAGTFGRYLDAQVANVETDTQDIQSRLPAALVGGRMDANVGAISADATAADNLEAALDGTGGVTITAALTGNITGNLSGSVGSVTGAVGSVTGNVGGNVVGSVASVTAITTSSGSVSVYDFTTAAKALLQAEAEDAIVTHRLDELLNADSDIDGAAPPAVGSVFHELMTKTTGSFTFDQTTDSLEALRDRGDAAWTTATGFSTHTAADVWAAATRTLTALDEDSTTLDLDATIRAAVGMSSANLDTQLTAIDDYLDTEVAAIYARIGAPAGASIAADIAAVKSETASILADTGTDGVVVASGSKTGYSLATAPPTVTEIWTTALTEAYASDGSAFTAAQGLFMIWSALSEFAISGTSITCKKLDGSTTSMVFTLDSSSSPTSRTRAS